MIAVDYFLSGMTKQASAYKRVSYPQIWKAYNEAQMNEKHEFMRLLYELCKEVPFEQNKRGRPKIPINDMIYISALKVYSTFSLRRFTTDMKRAKELGFIKKAPYFTTVSRYMENPELTPILIDLVRKSATPLNVIETDFAVDSSGFSTCRFKRWFDFKYGKEKNVRVWIKCHIMCGTKTNIVTNVSLTDSKSADIKQFEPLFKGTIENFNVKSLSADKAYSSRNTMNLVSRNGGSPYIPFRKNATGRSRGSKVWRKMYHMFMYKQDEFRKHYHRRSNVETTFHMIKTKFGDSVRSKSKTAQINEVLLKILCHNIVVLIHEMYELGFADI